MWRERSQISVNNLLVKYLELNTAVKDYIACMDIYFAETNSDNILRQHIEGAIGWNLRNKYPDYKVLYPDDNHIGKSKKALDIRLVINSDEPILGLDKEISL